MGTAHCPAAVHHHAEVTCSSWYAGRIDQGGTGIGSCRDAERFIDLFPRSAVTRRRLGVDGDAAIASDGDRKRLAISTIRMASRW
jgi:hypothetical protein